MGKKAKLREARNEIARLRYREQRIADIVFGGNVVDKSVNMVLEIQRLFPERLRTTWEEREDRIVAVDRMRSAPPQQTNQPQQTETTTLELTVGENCSSGDVLGIDWRYGVVHRWRDGDARLGIADRNYAQAERITWPPATSTPS